MERTGRRGTEARQTGRQASTGDKRGGERHDMENAKAKARRGGEITKLGQLVPATYGKGRESGRKERESAAAGKRRDCNME